MQGSLQEFGLAEILQLVAMQHKTGLLRVESYDKVLTFYFENGTLVSCRDRRRLGDDPLLEYMKKVGYLDAWQLLHLTLEVEENKKDAADVLLDKNLISEDDLHIAMVDMAQDLVFRTYNWKEGTYRFLSGDESLRGLRHPLALKMEAVLLEAARRVDEWPHILTKLPSPQVLLAPIATLPTSLDERSQALLSRLRSPMRLVELVACGRLPEYDVYEIVAAAVDAGITSILEMPRAPESTALRAGTPAAAVTAAATAPVAKPAAPQRTGSAARQALRPATIYWMLVLLVAGCGALVLGLRDGSAQQTHAEIQTLTARAVLQRDIETFRALRGSYPAALQELANMQLASPALCARAGVSSYSRTDAGKSYTITYVEAPKKR